MSVVIESDKWTEFEPDWTTVLKCPACGALIDNDWADCRECGVEVKHKTVALNQIRTFYRDRERGPRVE